MANLSRTWSSTGINAQPTTGDASSHKSTGNNKSSTSSSISHDAQGNTTNDNAGDEDHPRCTPPRLIDTGIHPDQKEDLSARATVVVVKNPVQLRLTPHASSTTLVLDNGKSIRINTDMLKHTSTYFSSMHRYPGAWPEARTGVVKLTGVDLATLEAYKYWLETGTIEDTDTLVPECCQLLRFNGMLWQETNKLRPVLVGNKTKIYVAPVKVHRLDQLIQCWIFADYIGAPAFQNDLMDSIFNIYGETYYEDYALPLYNIPFICKNAPSGVPLRAFIVDSIYSCLSGSVLKKASSFKLIPEDLAIAVAVLTMGGADSPYNSCLPPWQRNFCTWHVHPDGELNAPCEDPFTWNGKSKEELR